MSVCYWGDKFYGINRIENSHLFDEQKERKIIIKSLLDIWDEEDVVEAMEDYELTFGYPSETETDDGINDLTAFLEGTGVTAYNHYSSNGEILFFGIDFALPWELEKIETKEEVDLRIYNALKPILKDDVTFEQVNPLIKTIIINGVDDYVTYYEL